MERNLLEVFGQRDSARRAVAIAEIYTADCTFFEAEERIVVAWEGEPDGGEWVLPPRCTGYANSVTVDLRSSLPQPTRGPIAAVKSALSTTQYMSCR